MEHHIDLKSITNGQRTVGDDWMPATGCRALLLEDPAILWLDHHHRQFGFEKDKGEYSMSDYIMNAGRAFESAWIKNVAPEAVYAMQDDWEVRSIESVQRTMELLHARVPVIAHAALWNAENRIYGAADLIVLTSWMHDKFPFLRPAREEPYGYVVIDLKFTSGLQKPNKAKSLAVYKAQVRLYSYMLAGMTGSQPSTAYLITRDRHDDPIPVEITSKLGKPLEKDLEDLRERFVDIKLNGSQYTPWTHNELRPNFNNSLNAPWSAAIYKIATEYLEGRPLEWLPRVGHAQADALRRLGYPSLDAILTADPAQLPLEGIKGLGGGSARQIRAVLEANRSHKITNVRSELVPTKSDVELYVDYEFLSSLHIRPDDEPWPWCLQGCEMVFMIGVGWVDDDGKWTYNSYVAEAENHAAEKRIFEEFLALLDQMGVFDDRKDCKLFHYSPAERTQTNQAAQRSGLKKLRDLPWFDLRTVLVDMPLGVPNAFDYGLKTIAKSLSKIEPEFAVEWPSGLSDGAAASVVGWRMYESEKPLETEEFKLLSRYLEVDCRSLERVLAWLRSTTETANRAAANAYRIRPEHSQQRPWCWYPNAPDPLPSHGGRCWYR